MTELRKKLIISGFAFCLITGASFALNEDTKNYFDPINVMDSVLNFSIAKEESLNSVVSSGTLAFSDARQKFIHGNITASYSEFQKNLEKNKITQISISPNKEGSTYNITGKLKGYSNNETFYVVTPLSDDTLNYINEKQKQNNFKLTVSADPASSLLFKVIKP